MGRKKECGSGDPVPMRKRSGRGIPKGAVNGLGENYLRILAVSPRDARHYLWSERLGLIAFVGAAVALVVAVVSPLAALFGGSWRGLAHYLGGMVVLPLPFIAVLWASALFCKRVARRHGL